MDFQFMEILQIIFFVQRSKGLKLHKPLVLQRYRTNHVTYGLSLTKITSITISKIIRSCMHKIIVHTENPLISMLEGQPEINRKWFNKNIIQIANFCFRVKISQKLHDLRSNGVKKSNVLIFRPTVNIDDLTVPPFSRIICARKVSIEFFLNYVFCMETSSWTLRIK